MTSIRFFATVGLVLATQGVVGNSVNLDLMIPSTPSERVDPAAPPARADLFWKQNGQGWVIYWDRMLETPRYISPRARFNLVSGSGGTASDEAMLAAAARKLVTDNREFFGV